MINNDDMRDVADPTNRIIILKPVFFSFFHFGLRKQVCTFSTRLLQSSILSQTFHAIGISSQVLFYSLYGKGKM